MYDGCPCCKHILVSDVCSSCFCSQERAAKSLMSTAQHNRNKEKQVSIPEYPNEMMSHERKIRVRVLHPCCLVIIRRKDTIFLPKLQLQKHCLLYNLQQTQQTHCLCCVNENLYHANLICFNARGYIGFTVNVQGA